jgi:hypothetical protein
MTVLLGRRRIRRLWVAAAIACLASLALVTGPTAAHAATSPGFDDQASFFNLFYDCRQGQNPCPGHGAVSDVSSPSEDGDALEISYGSGNPPYMGVDAWNNASFGTDSSATRYQVNYDFYFPNKTPIQALEFCMNNYFGGKRYQWAMQWENIGTGAPQWRLWTGSTWKAVGVSATNVKAGTWYTLTIDGDIVGGQVNYMDFIIAGTEHNLGSSNHFNPTSESGPGLVAAVQLDGNGNSPATPYQVYIDNAHYYWS